MWEFSIEMLSDKINLARYLYTTLEGKIKEVSGVITSYELNSHITIVLACPEIEKVRMKYIISNAISNGVCTFLKEDFLSRHLHIPVEGALENYAFKQALVYFDRETDKFLVNKHLKLEKNIVLESFFYFQLLPLKEKWKELAGIANENGTYLLSEDSFIELLKFLIDNIEFLSDEVIIEVEKDNIKILDINENPIAEKEQISDFDLVDYLFKSSPRKINWSGEKRLLFLEKIFAKRIVYTNSLKEEKSIVQNFNFQKNL
ncbi:MAG: hypothetical protein IJA22_01340 [Clostridia bacterium]|nr:hypothetical protein [Clostridia bacterium]